MKGSLVICLFIYLLHNFKEGGRLVINLKNKMVKERKTNVG